MTTNFSKDPLVVRQFACRYPRNSVRLWSEQWGIGKHADGAKVVVREISDVYDKKKTNGLTSEL